MCNVLAIADFTDSFSLSKLTSSVALVFLPNVRVSGFYFREVLICISGGKTAFAYSEYGHPSNPEGHVFDEAIIFQLHLNPRLDRND